MTDIERIQKIEKIFGFNLHRVEKLENLKKEKELRGDFGETGTRNYYLDNNENVIGLSLEYCPIYLLPEDFLIGFNQLSTLSLKKSYLEDYSFLKDLKGLTGLDLSSNRLTDVSFLKELKGLTDFFKFKG